MKKVVYSDKAPKAVGPYSQAIMTEYFVFTSGQLPIDPTTGKFVEGDIKKQTRQVMENLKAILAAAGTDFSKVVKTTVYFNDINDFKQFNEVYAEYFPSEQPARSAFEVATLPLGATIEIEMIVLTN